MIRTGSTLVAFYEKDKEQVDTRCLLVLLVIVVGISGLWDSDR